MGVGVDAASSFRAALQLVPGSAGQGQQPRQLASSRLPIKGRRRGSVAALTAACLVAVISVTLVPNSFVAFVAAAISGRQQRAQARTACAGVKIRPLRSQTPGDPRTFPPAGYSEAQDYSEPQEFEVLSAPQDAEWLTEEEQDDFDDEEDDYYGGNSRMAERSAAEFAADDEYMDLDDADWEAIFDIIEEQEPIEAAPTSRQQMQQPKSQQRAAQGYDPLADAQDVDILESDDSWSPTVPRKRRNFTAEQVATYHVKKSRSAPVLTTILMGQRSASRLVNVLNTVSSRVPFNMIHAVVALQMLVKYEDEFRPPMLNERGMLELEDAIRRFLQRGEASVQELTTVVVASGTFGKRIPWLQEDLLPLAMPELALEHDEIPLERFLTIISAIGKLKQQRSELDTEVEKACSVLLESASSSLLVESLRLQELASLAWSLSCGTWEVSAELVTQILVKAKQEVTSRNPKVALTAQERVDLAMLGCALVKLDAHDDDFLGYLATRKWVLQRRMKDWSLAALAWTYSQAGYLSLSQALDAKSKAPARGHLRKVTKKMQAFLSYLTLQLRKYGFTQEKINAAARSNAGLERRSSMARKHSKLAS